MIYQSVTSEIVPGKIAEYNDIVAKELMPLMLKLGIKLVGAWHGYTGDVNKIYSLYVFKDLAEYQKIVTTREKDADFLRVSAKLTALRTRMNYTFLEPNDWSPTK
jgi:hypothetical protein